VKRFIAPLRALEARGEHSNAILHYRRRQPPQPLFDSYSKLQKVTVSSRQSIDLEPHWKPRRYQTDRNAQNGRSIARDDDRLRDDDRGPIKSPSPDLNGLISSRSRRAEKHGHQIGLVTNKFMGLPMLESAAICLYN
jgi:hypothetical protein